MSHSNAAENAAENQPCDALGRIPAPRPSAAARAQWRAARRFQVEVKHALGEPFVEWLLLETLAELLAEANSATSQAAIADRAGLSEKITSYWMTQLSELGFVDRAPDDDGRTYQVLLSKTGAELLDHFNARLERSGLIERG